MLFNSVEYLFFLPAVFIIYWFILNKSVRLQNIFLLAASYFFYGCWDARFLILLFASTLLDYTFGLLIHTSAKRKRMYMWLSVVNNLGILAVFKYYNFFATSAATLLEHLGVQAHPYLLAIVLPVGISFYTFHGMSYVFDIYNGKIKPTRNFIEYSVFVCFFPLLLAGPIERAWHLLPQIKMKRQFSYAQAVQGLRLILWGLFKKIVIGDSLSPVINEVFSNYQTASKVRLVMGAIYFALQIYADFSGYSDIARGSGKLLGFELFVNFRYPYFSRNITEFWKRWHISLTSWFTDYLYIPLGGNRKGRTRTIINIFIVFLVSGLWHGASNNFIIWGLLNAIAFTAFQLAGAKKTMGSIAKGTIMSVISDILSIVATFALVALLFVFFRAHSIGDGFYYIAGIFTHVYTRQGDNFLLFQPYLCLCLAFFFMMEWLARNEEPEQYWAGLKPFIRYMLYIIIAFFIIMFGSFNETPFIYFQF